MSDKLLKEYELESEGVNLKISIVHVEGEFVRSYLVDIPEFGPGTEALLKNLKSTLVTDTSIKTEKMLDSRFIGSLKTAFKARAGKILEKELPNVDERTKELLIGMLLHEMLGLGRMEFLLADGNLEEVVVNSSTEPAWVYHKEFGWLRTNVIISNESEIQNFASIIARRVGKQITVLHPLLDAHLISGDRANATLFPISGRGNTLTIRRFRREPWTVVDFITNNTATPELMALLWTAIQYELNVIVSGGTASGKTSFLNVLMPFIQPNHRIVSIEDTRELSLPKFLHWVPMTTREPNPEGQGGVSMLDLLINSLRMRPDRIIVGEIRRQKEAEVMFEAMHTGHSTYTTVHANTADETIRRLINPPIEIPATMLEATHINVVMFRNRRLGLRRILQLAEFIPERRSESEEVIKANVLYRWKPASDLIEKHADSIRLFDELSMHTGMTMSEISQDMKSKKGILEWLVKHKIRGVNDVGLIMAKYYSDKEDILKLVKQDKKPDFVR
ncbi:MAG: type II/IV secretion system ATPase subunit [Candidatus Diapherotrites archaeon]|nr:type II/IV secretion system ATPase subunit [Candidatus Micrarchaeota archaeon]